jgi:GT2 family glycosyltransferase
LDFCHGDYVLLLNPDTRLLEGAVEALHNFLENRPETGGVGSRYLNPDGSLQVSCYPLPTLGRELWRLLHLDVLYPVGVYAMGDWSVIHPRQVEVLQGASLMLRRQVIDQVGKLDEKYFMYTEEVDLCLRIQQAGWKLFWVPESRIIHYHGGSTRQNAELMFLWLYRSKWMYFRKHYGRYKARVYKGILFLASGLRIIFTPFVWLVRPGLRHQLSQTWSNYWSLIKVIPRW